MNTKDHKVVIISGGIHGRNNYIVQRSILKNLDAVSSLTLNLEQLQEIDLVGVFMLSIEIEKAHKQGKSISLVMGGNHTVRLAFLEAGLFNFVNNIPVLGLAC